MSTDSIEMYHLDLIQSLDKKANRVIAGQYTQEKEMEALVQLLKENMTDIVTIRLALTDEQLQSVCSEYDGFHCYILLMNDIYDLIQRGVLSESEGHVKH